MAPRLIATGIPELLPMVRTGDPRRHVSHVITKLCLKLGHFERTEVPSQSLMEVGTAWEDAVVAALSERYARSHPDRFVRPGELEKDGLIGTPDLFDILDNVMVEIKLTKLSSRHDIESIKFWKYWVQVKAYAYMMGVCKVRLHIGHINADYTFGSPDILYRVWEDEFTPRELFTNWRMLVSNADPVGSHEESIRRQLGGTA